MLQPISDKHPNSQNRLPRQRMPGKEIFLKNYFDFSDPLIVSLTVRVREKENISTVSVI